LKTPDFARTRLDYFKKTEVFFSLFLKTPGIARTRSDYLKINRVFFFIFSFLKTPGILHGRDQIIFKKIEIFFFIFENAWYCMDAIRLFKNK